MKKSGIVDTDDKKRAVIKKRRKLRAKRRFVIFMFLIVCVAVILIAFKAPFFAIKEVDIRIEPTNGGELTREPTKAQKEYILTTSEIRIGANIFSTSVGDAEKRLLDDPEIETAKVQRVFPNKIKITITEAVPIAYAEYGSQYLLIDGEGDIIRVAEKPKETEPSDEEKPEEISEPETTEEAAETVDGEREEPAEAQESTDTEADYADNVGGEAAEETPEDVTDKLVRVEGLEIVSDVAGTCMTAKDDARAEKLYECISILEDVGMLQKTDCVNFENLSDLKLEYEGRLDILLGNYENMEYKLKFIKKVIDEGISDYEQALLDYRGDKLYVGDRETGDAVPREDAEEQTDEVGAESASAEDAKETD